MLVDNFKLELYNTSKNTLEKKKWHNTGYTLTVIIFGLRFAFFTHIVGKKRTVSKYVR